MPTQRVTTVFLGEGQGAINCRQVFGGIKFTFFFPGLLGLFVSLRGLGVFVLDCLECLAIHCFLAKPSGTANQSHHSYNYDGGFVFIPEKDKLFFGVPRGPTSTAMLRSSLSGCRSFLSAMDHVRISSQVLGGRRTVQFSPSCATLFIGDWGNRWGITLG